MRRDVEEYAVVSELTGVVREGACASIERVAPKRTRQRVGKAAQSGSMDAALRTLVIQETERRRIASELHDGLGQMLTLLLLELRNAKATLATCIGESATAVSLERASTEACKAMAELRRSVMALYPSILDDLGLVASLSCLLRDVCQAEPGLLVQSLVSIVDAEVPKALHIVIFRIVQEAVNNVIKHAGASSVTLGLRKTGAILLLTIEDDGCGIEHCRAAVPTSRSGIAGMLRRAHVSGGEFTISSTPAAGTCLTATWPLAGIHDSAAPAHGS